MRERLWELMVKADINVRYWKSYEARVMWMEKISRLILISASVISVLAWALEKTYLPAATAISAFAAFVALVVVPSFGLEGYSSKVEAIRHRWIEIRDDYEELWADLDNGEAQSWEKRFQAAQKRDQSLEQGGLWAPESKKLICQAQTDSERVFVPRFFS